MHPYRTRFKKDIVAEFMPPRNYDPKKPQKVAILCDGMPSIPRKSSFLDFLSGKGYWGFYPRYRGAWESGGEFLKVSPEKDIIDVIDGLYKPIKDATWGKTFRINPKKIVVIGGSFGGPGALLASLDKRVDKAIAVCAVVDWDILNDRRTEKAETSNPSYVDYVHQAWGEAYRLKEKNWKRLKEGKIYNPVSRLREFDPKKIQMFHAKDDPVVRYKITAAFAEKTGIPLKAYKKGGHISTVHTVMKEWPKIKKFLNSK